jgi:Asp-tRNA(Asn)/Glu-tRNA(Gln) amidotransferase A subunit family amidase
MAQMVRQREASPIDLTRFALDRIERLEPALQAWELVDAEGAMAEAHRAEEAVMSGRPLGPLHGVPVAVKDIIDTAGIRTTMSSPIFKDRVPLYDAAAVARLKGAGAIVLGKTVSTPFAMGDPSRTRNPWRRDCTPGGSSSGSAVAVATGECPLALGTQTSGSVVRPAAFNGVTGFKPTYGLISRRGVFPVSWSLDTVGVLTRSVTDAAVALDVLAGYDEADPGSASRRHGPVAPQLVSSDSEPPRLGIVSGDIERSTSVELQAHMFEAIEYLRQGGQWVELFDLPISYLRIRDALLLVDIVETAAVHRKIFRERPEDYSPGVRAKIECGELVPASAYVSAQRLRRQFRQDMDGMMRSIDALIMPAAPGPAPADLTTTGDPAFCAPWSAAGLPAIAIPTGISQGGLPLAVQLVGRGFDDARLLRAARWVEERLAYRPSLPPLAPA